MDLSALLDVNDGDRPSRLSLGRQLTGELPETDAEALAEFRAAIDADRPKLPAFDFEVLRAAAERLEDPTPEPTPAKKTPWWRSWVVALVPVAVAMLALVVIQMPEDTSGNRIKGGSDLDFYVLQDGEARPGIDGERLRPGDRVQFTYKSEGPDTLVIVGVDGEGTVSIYYPEVSDEPEPIEPYGRRVLEGSIQLDDALGPEVFVGVFGGDVAEARALVEDAYQSESWAGLERLAREDPTIDVVRVEKAVE